MHGQVQCTLIITLDINNVIKEKPMTFVFTINMQVGTMQATMEKRNHPLCCEECFVEGSMLCGCRRWDSLSMNKTKCLRISLTLVIKFTMLLSCRGQVSVAATEPEPEPQSRLMSKVVRMLMVDMDVAGITLMTLLMYNRCAGHIQGAVMMSIDTAMSMK